MWSLRFDLNISRRTSVVLLSLTIGGLVGASARAESNADVVAPASGAANVGALGPRGAVDLALGLNPSYQAVLIAAQRARVVLDGEDERYTPTLRAGLDYTHGTSTSLNQSGVLRGSNDSVNGSIGVSQKFA